MGKTRPTFAHWELSLPAEMGGAEVTLRSLLTHIVQAEVEAFEARQSQRRLLTILSPEQIQLGAEQGKIDSGGSELDQTVDIQTAIDIALQAFTDGLYFVFLDGEQIEDLEARVVLTTVPPALFSEEMRDLDLVVSVAHQGGVDPEATASTVEMRSTLVRETCRLLKLANVQIQSQHVLVEGHLGSYSIHLGSAMVHRQPGGALCIIPVPSQHRGRIFLPFVDNDPKTAEVISKVVLLSKDKEIQDPTILEQIL